MYIFVLAGESIPARRFLVLHPTGYDRHSTLKKRSADTNDNFNKVIGNQVAINEGLEQLEVTVGESIEMMSINQFCEEQESSSFLDIVRTNVRKYTTLLRDFLNSQFHRI